MNEPYELTHTDLSCAKAFPKVKIKIECECARLSRRLSASCSSQSSTSMLSARWFATAIARRARRTHSARQMHTFIESICPQGHNLLFFIFISFMALVERYCRCTSTSIHRNPNFIFVEYYFMETRNNVANPHQSTAAALYVFSTATHLCRRGYICASRVPFATEFTQ